VSMAGSRTRLSVRAHRTAEAAWGT
jgi:hypothetical protein